MTDQNQNLLPLPTPPSSRQEQTFVPGKFDYIKPENSNYKAMLVNAYQAITQTETWDFVKQDCESFMFSKDPRISVISNKMIQLGYDGHTLSSFGCTMRDMQYIAQNGEKNFMELYLRNIKYLNL